VIPKPYFIRVKRFVFEAFGGKEGKRGEKTNMCSWNVEVREWG